MSRGVMRIALNGTFLIPALLAAMGDPGVWRAEVTLTDKSRNVTLPLKAEFTLAKKAEKKGK